MILTNVFIAVIALTKTTVVTVHVLVFNYSLTVIALLDSITNNICFTLNLGSIFKVILKSPLAEEFSVALFANYFVTLTFLILCVGEAR